MILKMTGITLIYLLLTMGVWYLYKGKKLSIFDKVIIGLIFAASSVMSTHFGVDYDGMVMNVRDMGPLVSGLFFSPVSGIIAGLIGGIERYIAGTYFGVGSYTRIACSVSTCLAGFIAMVMNIKVFRGKKPSPFYAFFMGAVMEVFHMYVVFVTHRADMRMAFTVVSTCANPMIIFTGLGMAGTSVMLQIYTGEWKNPFLKKKEDTVPVSQKFQRWLFIITSIVIIGNFLFAYMIQTQTAVQESRNTLDRNAKIVKTCYMAGKTTPDTENNIEYAVISPEGKVLYGKKLNSSISPVEFEVFKKNVGKVFVGSFFGTKSHIFAEKDYGGLLFITAMDDSEVYWHRDAQAYELALGDILLFTVVYVLIAFLVNQIVVNNIKLINDSLSKITNGDLNEVVTVRSSSEFASLSDDINQTVLTLKGYIAAAEKRIEQELILAKTIQESSLPKNFTFPDRDEFEMYASMKPAKEVGGDFYDFFFVERDKLALVIADVSGKGIPAALFMMRSKTAIRSFAESGASPSEIMMKANNALCEGNDAEMFVTSWLGILDLKTGLMKCSNAGHEYPVIKHKDGDYELIKDRHTLALAAMPDTKAREYEIQLEPGDRLFVYTDGVPEAIDENEVQYGTERMLNTLNRTKGMSVEEVLSAMSEDLAEFKGSADQFDDITMIGFEFIKKCDRN